MFNLFKTKMAQQPASNGKTIEEQIHNDIYSAQELIMEEAKKILAIPASFDFTKAQRLNQLEKLGFENFDEVKKLRQERAQQKEHGELIAMINYYRKIYPFHKFISQKSVQNIIKKYNLLLARAEDYIAEIPEKNQQEIINFKIRRKDIREPKEIRNGWQPMFMPSLWDFRSNDFSYRYNQMMAAQSGDSEKYYKDLEKKKREQKRKEERELISGKDLLIIAPQHKLDMTGKYVKDGVLRIKDPIVLQPVVCGYLIISSWGLEAADPLVLNPINN